jgi:hypothetical protein
MSSVGGQAVLYVHASGAGEDVKLQCGRGDKTSRCRQKWPSDILCTSTSTHGLHDVGRRHSPYLVPAALGKKQVSLLLKHHLPIQLYNRSATYFAASGASFS